MNNNRIAERNEFLHKLVKLQREYNMYVTSDVGPMGVYVDDKTTNELFFFDEDGKYDGATKN